MGALKIIWKYVSPTPLHLPDAHGWTPLCFSWRMERNLTLKLTLLRPSLQLALSTKYYVWLIWR
jgi:hypothetical protein